MTRVITKTVIFAHSFVVAGMDGEQLPGVYTIEMEEEMRTLSTVLLCPSASGITRVAIDPTALNATLTRDPRAPD
jgi:hypothetical protein